MTTEIGGPLHWARLISATARSRTQILDLAYQQSQDVSAGNIIHAVYGIGYCFEM